jgi:CRISPR-associated protein Cmr4
MSEATTNSSTQTAHQAGALLFIHAQTGLHPGSGTALGTVDLPVQRERHTQWPIIPSSTLKGILRDAIREKVKGNYQPEFEEKEENGQTRRVLKRSQRQVANEDDPDLVAIFGPGKVGPDTSHAGALSLTDARILAFPVRSLKGVFAWVTCRAVLERLQRDLSLIQANSNAFTLPDAPVKDMALCAANSPLLVDGNKLVLEEFDFVRTGDVGAVANWVSQRAVADEATQRRLQSHLVVLYDDDFTHFARHATEIVARVGLDYERKTVKSGALFYEEFLPAETLFYSVVLASSSRRDGHDRSASEILRYLRDNMPPVLQIGGDETIGKGLCSVRLDING